MPGIRRALQRGALACVLGCVGLVVLAPLGVLPYFIRCGTRPVRRR